MPNCKTNNNSKNDQSRFERLTKSVLESDHPVFGKIKKELPQLNNRQVQYKSDWHRIFSELNVRFGLGQKFVIFLMCTVISFFIFRQITDPHLDYRLGTYADRPLIARSTVEIIDKESTEAKIADAVASVRPVFDYDRGQVKELRERVEKGFLLMRKKYPRILRQKQPNQRAVDVARADLSTALGVTVTIEEFEVLRQGRFSKVIERVFNILLENVNKGLIVSDRSLLGNLGDKGITVNTIEADVGLESKAQQREITLSSLRPISDLNKAKKQLEDEAAKMFSGRLRKFRASLTSLGKRLLVPNLTMNRQETESRKLSARDEIKPSIIKIEKGEVIIPYNEKISRRHMKILNYLEQARQAENTFFKFFFTVIFITILMYSLYSITSGGLDRFSYKRRDLAVFLSLMVLQIITLQAIQYLAIDVFVDKFPHIPFEFYYFLFPIASAPIVIRMLTAKEPALLFTLVSAIVCGILLERNFFYACYVLASSLTAVNLVRRVKTRGDMYLVGLITGFVNIAVIICIVASTRNAATLSMLVDDIRWIIIAGLTSGLLSAAVAVAIIPLVEYFSGHTTDLKLLELANMNHPLLRDLMVKAPGTYHHSIVIGSLVEAGAEAIGANPLLARVMAYYHDVGKMERPLYFIENQQGGYNKHDSLQPHMSAMIIREHVKKGQELGRKHKLPDQVIAAMSEHHGSSTITYFYNKARAMADDPNSVLESDYKYDGQKPQTKETALVMLGDVTEAATRSVADPTPLRLSGIVKNVLNKYFAEGQLSECDLTLRDLDLIAKSFLDVLVGIYHARIEYNVGISAGGKVRAPGVSNRKKNNEGDDRSTEGKQAKDSGSSGSITTITGAVKNQSAGGSGSGKR